jgi:hypothetical protein
MKRVSLKDQFHGEPDPNQEGIAATYGEKDQVILNVVSGAISFMVPSDVPDDEVTQDQYLERFVNCTLQLENGAQLLVWINSGSSGVEVQIEPPRQLKQGIKKRGRKASEGEWR